jgi:hypothetical protein
MLSLEGALPRAIILQRHGLDRSAALALGGIRIIESPFYLKCRDVKSTEK